MGRRSTKRLSEHAWLEIAHAEHAGHRPGNPPSLDPDDPVPGCSCPRCLVLARGRTPEEAAAVEELVRDLAHLDPADRLPTAARIRREAGDLDVPSPGWLVRRAAAISGSLEPTPDAGDRTPLPVEEARTTSILDVARRLGLGDPERRGGEYVVRCPIHDDHDPSLRLNPEKGPPGGVWRCWPCVDGGDAIDLVKATHGVEFPDAVRWIAGGGHP